MMRIYSGIAKRMAYWLGIMSCCGFMIFFPKLSYSAVQAPRIVDVGVYLINIPSVNLKEKQFQADFYVWFRWTGGDMDPLETFEIVNGHIDSKDGVVKKKIGNVNYALCRVGATVYRNFDLSRYPLDKQTLKIQIEDTKSTEAEMIYRPDKANIAISPKIDIAGWHITKVDSYESVTTYPTNYGDISLPNNTESKVPRFTFSLSLDRGGYAIFIKLFAMLFLAGGLTFCAFGVRSNHIGERLTLILAGVFLAAITQSTLASVLPESDTFCMADMLYNLTMAIILFIFLISIYTFKVFQGGDEPKAERISSLSGRLLFAVYVIGNCLIVALS